MMMFKEKVRSGGNDVNNGKISTTTRTISERGNERRPYKKNRGTGRSWLKTARVNFFNGGRLE
jgi:hypothetical protein